MKMQHIVEKTTTDFDCCKNDTLFLVPKFYLGMPAMTLSVRRVVYKERCKNAFRNDVWKYNSRVLSPALVQGNLALLRSTLVQGNLERRKTAYAIYHRFDKHVGSHSHKAWL